MPAIEAAQLAVNIMDYGDYDFNNGTIRADIRTRLDSGDPNKPFSELRRLSI